MRAFAMTTKFAGHRQDVGMVSRDRTDACLPDVIAGEAHVRLGADYKASRLARSRKGKDLHSFNMVIVRRKSRRSAPYCRGLQSRKAASPLLPATAW